MTKRGHDTPHFDAERYPRTYVFSSLVRWILMPLGLLVFAGCLFGIVYFVFVVDIQRPGRIVMGGIMAAFSALGVYLAVGAHSYRVNLSADSIEVFDGLRRRRLKRAEIAGRQRLANQIGASWALIPKIALGRKLQLSSFLETDKDFSDWILSLSDLDENKKAAAAREASEATETLKARGFDTTAIRRLRQLAIGIGVAPYALGIGVWFLPNPHHVLTWASVAVPWLAIGLVARFTPFYRIGGPRKSPIPDLTLAVIVPGCLLTLQALNSVFPVGWQPTFALSLVFCFGLWAAAMLADPWLREHRVTALLLAVLCCGYGYGAGLEVNALLDGSTPINHPVAVLSKRVSHGRSTTYYLGLAPWGPYHTSEDVMVPGWRYRQTQIGDSVCVALRTGALGVAWYTVGSCGDIPL